MSHFHPGSPPEHAETEPSDAADGALAAIGRGWAGLAALVGLARSPTAWRAERSAAPDPDPADDPADDQGRAPGLDQLSRRAFFRLAGAGAAAAGIAACSSRPARDILPYANQPPELTPGVPLHYATALVEDGFATGVVVAAHEGRPTKLEGNPDHPASLGATRARDQAAILSLYDPQRAREATDRGVPVAWSAIERLLADAGARGGRGVHLLLEPTSSPFVIELIGRIRAALPDAGVTFWAPFAPRAALDGNRLAFGRPLQTQLDLRDADVIVDLDADITNDHPMALAYARQIADRRRVVDGSSTMSRLYVIEAGYTTTGVVADHRLRARPGEIPALAADLLAAVLAAGAPHATPPALAAALRGSGGRGATAPAIAAIARDLVRAGGRAAIAVGERQPPVVHAIAAAIHAALGSLGRTARLSEPVVFEAGQPSHDIPALAALANACARGDVATLLVLGGNPVYGSPADLALGDAFAGVPTSLYLGRYADETARTCRYLVPALHDLERWDAVRGYDGTLTPIQPLIEPLFGGRSVADVLHALLGDPPAAAHDRARAAWARVAPGVDVDAALARGAVAGSAAAVVRAAPVWDALIPAIAAAGAGAAPPPRPDTLDLQIAPHPYVRDGRYTNNPWLLELPEPVTKLTWDNAAQLSPRTAARLGVRDGDAVALTVSAGEPGAALELPAIIVPGHADDAITVHAGFGRDGSEAIARGIGGNAFRMWTRRGGLTPAVTATARGRHRSLAITQLEQRQHGRPVALTGTLDMLRGEAFRAELAAQRGPQPSLMPPDSRFRAAGPQWAMSIDLTTCTGCSACVMACAAENNTPVVGARAVRNKREMHWLRINRYVVDEGDDAAVIVQPMTCQHCEQAPCEYVCPVEATAHSPDGLNEMTYNRCIGTRFCSNNCPYKVRRFNWFDLKEHHGLRLAARNPDVTVRDRGVMEKCTYCVQRIRRAEIDARIADRPLGSVDVRTACQQACPTSAIAFGSITDPGSMVSEHRRRPHSYAVLHDQGTVPRTRYLARIRNPGDLPGAAPGGGE